MISNERNTERIALQSEQSIDCLLPSISSSEDGLPSSVVSPNISLKDAQNLGMYNRRSLKRYVSTPVLPYSSTATGFRPVTVTDTSVQIPIVGYEVMEERARFTVYKIKIENKMIGDSWFIFRRYTDFVRLHSKLKSEFPQKTVTLPRKRWFGNNFSQPFIEERILGLQRLIDKVTDDKELLESSTVRQFFCLDEPASYSEIGEESRAIFDALEDTIYHLRKQLRTKEAEIINIRMAVSGAQEKAVTITEKLKEVAKCSVCREKVQGVVEDLQRVLCIQFPSTVC